jgi:hypothetical protein
MRPRRAMVLATATMALVAGSAATADGAILLQHGIGGVRLGQTEGKVRAVRGVPVRVVRARNEFGGYIQLRYRGLTVTFQGGRRVTAVSTRGRTERTNRGVGVGSTKAELLAAHPSVTCPDTFHCVVGREEPGRTVSSFALRSGVVRQVTIGFVID